MVTNVFGMGQAPSTCDNRYDGTITTLTVVYQNKTYYPLENPGVTFQADNSKSYQVSFTIRTPSLSSQNNSLAGSTWYDNNAVGYQMGTCVNGVNHNQDVTLTVSASHPGNMPQETTQTVMWNTLVGQPVTFYVQWVNQTVTVPDAPYGLTATAASSSTIDLNWNAPNNDGGSAITGYQIERSTDDGNNWSTIVPHINSTSYTDTRLSPNATYTYRIEAINSVGASEQSNTESATTLLLGPLIGGIAIGPIRIPLPHFH